jgi:hypothetical protein
MRRIWRQVEQFERVVEAGDVFLDQLGLVNPGIGLASSAFRPPSANFANHRKTVGMFTP